MIFNKNRVLYFFLITSMYISLFIPIIEGIVRKISPDNIMYVKGVTQGYIFVLPIFMVFLTKLNIRRFYLVVILFLYIIITQPFTEFTSFISVSQGYKSFLAILLYIPIIHYLVKNYDYFDIKIEQHIKFIFILTLCIFYFEIISRYIKNDLYLWFISLAYYDTLGIVYSRPIGIGLDIHLQGIIISSAIFYYFINNQYKVSFLFYFALFLSGIKTWLIGVTFVSIIFFLLNLNKLKLANILKYFFILFFIMLISIFLFYAQIEHYLVQLSPSSNVASYMTDLWSGSIDFVLHSIVPSGFLTDFDRSMYISKEIDRYTNITILFFGYMIGSLGMLLYIVIVYYDIFKRSKYTSIIILSLFSLVHVYHLNKVGIFIIIMYFSMYYIIEKKRNFILNTKISRE